MALPTFPVPMIAIVVIAGASRGATRAT
jgi:hypothetical protein